MIGDGRGLTCDGSSDAAAIRTLDRLALTTGAFDGEDRIGDVGRNACAQTAPPTTNAAVAHFIDTFQS